MTMPLARIHGTVVLLVAIYGLPLPTEVSLGNQ